MHNFYSISTNFSSSLSIAITLISCTASSTSALLNELTTKMLSFNACSCQGQCVGNKAKGQISKRVFQENKARHIFRKTNISYPLIHTRTCTYHWVGNVRVSENLTRFVFLKHSFWDSLFYLITDQCFACISFWEEI